MGKPFQKVLRFRKLILGIWAVATALGALLLVGNFRIDNSVGVWWPEDDPALAQYDWYLEEFGPWEWTLILLETDDVDDPRFLSELRQLTDELEGLQHVRRALSLANVPAMGVQDTEDPSFAELDIRRILVRDGDSRHTIVLLETANFIRREEPYRIPLLEGIGKAVEAYPSITSYRVAGTSVVNVALNETARRDMFLFFSLVGVLLFVISLALFRSWRDTIILTTVSSSTAAITLGLIVLCGYSFNIITIMLPTVLIALTVADLIHLIHAFHQSRPREGASSALDRALSELWLPCLGTSVTTIAGFLSLSGSTMLPVFQLAVFSSFGIALAWVLTVTVAPLLLHLLWRGELRERGALFGSQPSYLVALGKFLPGRAGPVFALFGFSCVALAGLPLLETNTNYVKFFRPGTTVPETYSEIEKIGFPQNPIVLVLSSPVEGLLARPDYQVTVLEFEDKVRGMAEVEFVLSPFTNLAGTSGFTSEDGRKYKMVLLTDFMGSREIARVKKEIYRIGRQTLSPDLGLLITGSPVLWASMDEDLIETQKSSIVIVSVVALVVLAIVFQSFSYAILGCLVSFFPVAMILGLMGFLDVPLSLATVLIAGIAVGLAVDDTIHFIFAFRRWRAEGLSRNRAASRTLTQIGSRMILTSLILTGSFGCMAVSDFVPSANFGVFTGLTILAALVVDLTLLPLILGFGGILVRKKMGARLSAFRFELDSR